MHGAGVKRLVAVTSSALAPHPEPLGGFFFERVLQPYVVNKLGRTSTTTCAGWSGSSPSSDLIWTILRPSGLCSAADVSDYLVEPDHVGHRFTTASISPTACCARPSRIATHGAAIAVATPSAHPSMLSLIWREGIRKPS